MKLELDGHTAYAYTGGKPFDPALPGVVFVHGALHDHSVWILQSRYLAHHGCAVLAVDLPAHGRSGGAPLGVQVAGRWIAALVQATGLQHVALVGHSMGSLIALEAAAVLGARASRLIMVGTASVARANQRLMLYRIEKDLYSYFDQIIDKSDKAGSKARKELTHQLVVISPFFQRTRFFLSDEFSLVDCTLAPLLWRLPVLGIALPRQAQPLLDYADRLFCRPAFKKSLTDLESEMRP